MAAVDRTAAVQTAVVQKVMEQTSVGRRASTTIRRLRLLRQPRNRSQDPRPPELELEPESKPVSEHFRND